MLTLLIVFSAVAIIGIVYSLCSAVKAVNDRAVERYDYSPLSGSNIFGMAACFLPTVVGAIVSHGGRLLPDLVAGIVLTVVAITLLLRHIARKTDPKTAFTISAPLLILGVLSGLVAVLFIASLFGSSTNDRDRYA